ASPPRSAPCPGRARAGPRRAPAPRPGAWRDAAHGGVDASPVLPPAALGAARQELLLLLRLLVLLQRVEELHGAFPGHPGLLLEALLFALLRGLLLVLPLRALRLLVGLRLPILLLLVLLLLLILILVLVLL